jgi:hypothetical protein
VEGATASAATATAKETFGKTISVVVEIFVPVGFAVAGFFMPTVLGGGSAIGSAINKSIGQGSSLTNRAAWGIQGLIDAMVGGAFWALRGHGHIIAKAIGGAVGGFFLGGAVGCLPGLISGSIPPAGLIDKLVSSVENVAAEG